MLGCTFVSVMSVWEVGLLHAKQRVVLGLALPIWVQRALAPPIAASGLTPEIAIGCHQLHPGSFTAIRSIVSSWRPRVRRT
jgi:PIN domain nuclease of toxin-antitoxin system